MAVRVLMAFAAIIALLTVLRAVERNQKVSEDTRAVCEFASQAASRCSTACTPEGEAAVRQVN